MDVKQLEKISKALGDVTRLKILMEMSCCKGNLQCAELKNITQLAQPSVSHHIKTLIEAELIEPEKDGRNHSYQLNKSVLKEYINALSKMCTKA